MRILNKFAKLSQKSRDIISMILIVCSCLAISVYIVHHVDVSMRVQDKTTHRIFAGIIAFFFSAVIITSFCFMRLQRSIVAQAVLNSQRFRHVADSSGDWIWEIDRDGRYVYSSKGVKNILGYEPDEIIGKKYFYDFCFPKDGDSLKQKADQQLNQRQFFIYEIGRRQHKDGHEVILEVKGFAIQNYKGEVLGYRGIDRDITEMRKAQETIRKERNFVSAILDVVGALVVVLDVGGRIVRFNRTCEWISGYMFDEVKGKYIWDLFIIPEEIEKVKERFRRLKESERSNEGENYWVTKDGERRLIKWSNSTLVGEYIIGTGIDITEQRAAEIEIQEHRKALERTNEDLAANEQLLRDMVHDLQRTNRELKETQDKLIQSEKMASVGMTSSAIAHEVKNPMAIILQSMERIEKVLAKTGDGGGQYVQRIRNAAQRANRVIDSLLIFSRQSELKMKPLYIHKTIDSTITLVESKAQQNNVSIRREYEENEPMISGDDVMLQQVFFDLLINSIDAMPKGGEVFITTQSKGLAKIDEPKSLIVKVRDIGEGISQDIRSMVFDPFFTTKEPGVGTGLGLSIVYLILERHRSTITFDSEPGSGTTFTITFPVIESDNSQKEGQNG